MDSIQPLLLWLGLGLTVVVLIGIVKLVIKKHKEKGFIKGLILAIIIPTSTVVLPVILVHTFVDEYSSRTYHYVAEDSDTTVYEDNVFAYDTVELVYDSTLQEWIDTLANEEDFELEDSSFVEASLNEKSWIADVIDGYEHKWEIDRNYEHHFTEVMSFRYLMNYERRMINYSEDHFADMDESRQLREEYTAYSKSDDSTVSDIGNLFLALHHSHIGSTPQKIMGYFNAVSDSTVPYYFFVKGRVYYKGDQWDLVDESERCFYKSIELGEAVSDSYNDLAQLYHYYWKYEKLCDLVYNEDISEYVPAWAKRDVYFNELDLDSYWMHILSYEWGAMSWVAFFASLGIFALWMHFLRKTDIYEPEKWHHLIIVFLMSVVFMHLLYPIHDILEEWFHYYRPYLPIKDLGYLTVTIGMVEEFVKILPVFVMLKFSKAIDEPFDFVLYASVSALGFAFVENISYFGYGLHNISTRGILCCTLHVCLSATVGYAMMLGRYRKNYNPYFLFLIGFLLASFLHGMYDFYLMNWWAVEYSWLSYLILLLMIYLWSLYANNSLNISNFYNPEVAYKADKMKVRLLTILIAILMIGYVSVSIEFGSKSGDNYLVSEAKRLYFFVLFITLSLSSLRIVKGYLSPFRYPLHSLLPIPKGLRKIEHQWAVFSSTRKFKIKEELVSDRKKLNQAVLIENRIILAGNSNCYKAKLSEPLTICGYHSNEIIVIPEWDKKLPWAKSRTLVRILLIPLDLDLNKGLLEESDFKRLGRVFSTYLEDPKGIIEE